jgi:hypothetical protein
MDAPTRFRARQQPYDIAKDGKLIRSAHLRRHTKLKTQLNKIDRYHPGAYGITIINPELGYHKINVTQSLQGFEETAPFQQFLAEMDAYIQRKSDGYIFTSEQRHEASSATLSEVFSHNKNGAHTRDALRTLLTSFATHPTYQPEWKSSNLTIKVIVEEFQVNSNYLR